MRLTSRLHLIVAAAGLAAASSAHALELNWAGQFWSEFHNVNNYTMDGTDAGLRIDPARLDAQGQPAGYYIPSGGSNNASFQTLFLRLKPNVVVNDNIYIKSEWWVGDPVFGMFGNAVPFSTDQRMYYSNQSRGSTISAQRFWAELLSDFGTVQVGRAPLNWGLGLVWSSGDSLWSRYETTGDTIRLVSKFGAFSFAPAFILYSAGNNIGGACTINSATGLCTPTTGRSGIADYSLQLKYENLEEDFEFGLNFVKRLASGSQDATYSLGPIASGATAPSAPNQPAPTNFNIWDIVAKKRLGTLTLAGELPVTSGHVAGLDYSTLAFAAEVDWKISDSFESFLRAGHAPGQPNTTNASGVPSDYNAFFFNPNYRLGMVMFNYQLANFAGYPGTNTLNSTSASAGNLRSPWDNPIVNANYLALDTAYKTQKWTFNLGLVYANAIETARPGEFYFNTWQRRMVQAAGTQTQDDALGFELDLGAAFQWDDWMTFRLDTGFFFPGAFYEYTGTAANAVNATDTVWATAARIGVNF